MRPRNRHPIVFAEGPVVWTNWPRSAARRRGGAAWLSIGAEVTPIDTLLLMRNEARRIAVNFGKLPKLLHRSEL